MCVFRSSRLLGWLVSARLVTFGVAHAADYTVTSTADSGAGSLRQALLNANDNAGLDRILFQIPGGGVKTITPATPLPPVIDPVVLDATTQPGYVDRPVVELNGSSAGVNAGLRVLAGNSVIRGLCVNRFGADGIRVEGPGTNLLQANFVGTDPTGLVERANSGEGILIFNSFGNVIGGTNATDRNVLSGNGDAGVYILNGGGNVVQGNRIGTAHSGLAAIRNSNNGVIIYASRGNVVGGVAPGARNVISGNTGSGVYITGAASVENQVLGNYIGVNAPATAALSNSADGITISGAPSNTLGGATTGAGNLLSGNGGAGIFLNGAATRGNRVQNNWIGCDGAGTRAIGNRLAGVTMLGAVSNFLGGSSSLAGNIISGNQQDGIYCATNTVGNFIQGNWIGLDATGARGLANSMNGIAFNGARSNVIGGASTGLGNVVSGNALHGIAFSNRSSGNVLLGNRIGTDVSGLAAVSNLRAGVRVDSAGNRIGGTEAGARNVISGNVLDGIWIAGNVSSNNIVQGNWIGVSARGTNILANGRAGIGVVDAPYNTIGGVLEGAGNVLSGNAEAGIYLFLLGAMENRIQGNRIGTDPSGMLPLGNQWEGIYLESVRSNYIGGVESGAGNLVSANKTRGIWLTNSSGNVIQDNWIGVAADGARNFGNTFHSLELSLGCNNNTIGGDVAGSNRIAYALGQYAGIRIRDGATRNAILHNEVFGNGGMGIDLGVAGAQGIDNCDADSGANEGQNFPELTRVVAANPFGLSVAGELRSTALGTFVLRFYGNPQCDSSGYGEGQVYLGRHTVTVGSSCRETFSARLAAPLPDGFVVTATATDGNGNTSEFSACAPSERPPRLRARLDPAANALAISWTNQPGGFELKQTFDLRPPVAWQSVTNTAQLSANEWVVHLPVAQTNVFYALDVK